jgi:DNA-binding SARP family transcriptional activator
MNSLQIALFGKISIQQNGQPQANLPAKALELLCYLLLYRERSHTRETLSEALWPDGDHTRSMKYLRQTLWQLQTTLDNPPTRDQAEGQSLFILNPGWVHINRQANWWLDVDIFEQAYALCCDIAGQDLADQQAQTLEEAVALYQGDLLEMWYQDWCIFERERLQLTYLAMLEKLMGYCEVRRLYTKGIAYGQCILRYDPAWERAHRQLMRLYYSAGDRTSALRQYARCATAVAKEFDLPPSPETVALYEQIRANRLEDAPTSSPVQPQPTAKSPTDLLLDLHKRLDKIQTNLFVVQNQVQQELDAISHALKSELKMLQQTP